MLAKLNLFQIRLGMDPIEYHRHQLLRKFQSQQKSKIRANLLLELLIDMELTKTQRRQLSRKLLNQ